MNASFDEPKQTPHIGANGQQAPTAGPPSHDQNFQPQGPSFQQQPQPQQRLEEQAQPPPQYPFQQVRYGYSMEGPNHGYYVPSQPSVYSSQSSTHSHNVVPEQQWAQQPQPQPANYDGYDDSTSGYAQSDDVYANMAAQSQYHNSYQFSPSHQYAHQNQPYYYPQQGQDLQLAYSATSGHQTYTADQMSMLERQYMLQQAATTVPVEGDSDLSPSLGALTLSDQQGMTGRSNNNESLVNRLSLAQQHVVNNGVPGPEGEELLQKEPPVYQQHERQRQHQHNPSRVRGHGGRSHNHGASRNRSHTSVHNRGHGSSPPPPSRDAASRGHVMQRDHKLGSSQLKDAKTSPSPVLSSSSSIPLVSNSKKPVLLKKPRVALPTGSAREQQTILDIVNGPATSSSSVADISMDSNSFQHIPSVPPHVPTKPIEPARKPVSYADALSNPSHKAMRSLMHDSSPVQRPVDAPVTSSKRQNQTRDSTRAQSGFRQTVTRQIAPHDVSTEQKKPKSMNYHLPTHLQGVNPSTFPISPKSARFFVIKSYGEDDIHKSIKYGVWASTNNGNKRLDKAYKMALEEGNCPVYLFYSVNASRCFCGVSRMESDVDYSKSFSAWVQGNKWNGRFNVKWIFIKDIPNINFIQLRLQNNNNKPVTNSRDCQEIPQRQGCEMLRIFLHYQHETSIIDDFEYYDERQREMEESKKREQKQAESETETQRDSFSADFTRESERGGRRRGGNRGGRGRGRGRGHGRGRGRGEIRGYQSTRPERASDDVDAGHNAVVRVQQKTC